MRKILWGEFFGFSVIYNKKLKKLDKMQYKISGRCII